LGFDSLPPTVHSELIHDLNDFRPFQGEVQANTPFGEQVPGEVSRVQVAEIDMLQVIIILVHLLMIPEVRDIISLYHNHCFFS
jgi:hypothetical protein